MLAGLSAGATMTVEGEGIYVEVSSTVSLRCNDVWGNTGGDYSGVPPTGILYSISSDPLFCDLAGLDVHLNDPSLCAKAHNLYCGLIGALDVGCTGSVRTLPATWGSIKAMYH
jgi:hypothetical protein